MSFLRCCVFIVLVTSLLSPSEAVGQSESWHSSNPGFRPLAITASGGTIWVAGVGAGIASSEDGEHWTEAHPRSEGGATLNGIDFYSDSFGYAYGTGGTLLTTEDGGKTWNERHPLDQTILLASLSDTTHGLLRTSEHLFYMDGNGDPKIISAPAEIFKKFSYTPSLVALTPDKMAVLLSEGPYSEAGFLATVDGGKTWKFYDPPSTGISSFVRVAGKYWATGHEVVGKDKPGGGGSVPLAMSSDDGLQWVHTTNEIHPCHWEICGICNRAGCLASNTLLVNFFEPAGTRFFSIPANDLTAKWAVLKSQICTINTDVKCAALGEPKDVEAQPTSPEPKEPLLPPLGTTIPKDKLLRCMSCGFEPVYKDDKVQGQFKLHAALTVAADGTIAAVTISNAPTEAIRQKVQAQISDWLFEPPIKDDKPVRISTAIDFPINVIRPR